MPSIPGTPRPGPDRLDLRKPRGSAGIKLDIRRKSHAIGLKVASTVASVMPAYKQRLLRGQSLDALGNGSRPVFITSISMCRVSGLDLIIESSLNLPVNLH